jgi:hypothetical protein
MCFAFVVNNKKREGKKIFLTGAKENEGMEEMKKEREKE